MTLVQTDTTLLGQIDALRDDVPSWLADLRRRGADTFDREGIPTPRLEEWRLTDVRGIEKLAFAPADDVQLSRGDLDRFAIPGLDAHTLVFVDGRYNDELSLTTDLPDAVTVGSLAAHLHDSAVLLQPHLGRYATPESDPFVALNSAYLGEGAFIHVPARTTLAKPVLLLFVSTDSGGGQPTMSHPRVLFLCEDHTKADVIEHHVALSDRSVYFSNAVTEVVVGEHAEVSHTFIERDSVEAYNVSSLVVHQRGHSRFSSHSMLVGGKVVRNNIRPILAGEHCWSLLNGLYMPDGKRTIDNHMYVHHQAPNCESRQYFTGLLRGESTGVFIGRIKVERPAQKTDAVQSSRNLLMSDGAHAHNRPQLEIFADDVKCTHGSTTGQIDEQSVFYLRARGVPEDVARGMLIYAFANESLDRIAIEPVRQELARLLVNELNLGDAVGSVIE